MDKYFCANGEAVEVRKDFRHPGHVLVFYRGKVYQRPESALGIKLFREDPTVIGIGCTILLEDAETGDRLNVLLTASKTETKYQAMGGSYYGAKTKELPVCPEREDPGLTAVTDQSPLGQAILGKKSGCSVSVEVGGKALVYRILHFEPRNNP